MLAEYIHRMPGLMKKGILRGHTAPAAPLPKYIMPSPRPWNWPPDWPIATRDQIMAGISPDQTPGSSLLKGKGLTRSPTVGELSELMKQEAEKRMTSRAVLTRPLSAQQLDCHMRKNDMRGAEHCEETTVPRISIGHEQSKDAKLRGFDGSESDLASPTSSSEAESIRMDPGMGIDSSSDGGSARSDVSGAEYGVEQTSKKVPVLLKSRNVREGRGEQTSNKHILKSTKKLSSLIGSLRERLQGELKAFPTE